MLPSNDTMSKADRAILGMTPADIERFWSKVDKSPGQGPKGECWGWTFAVGSGGYGRFQIGHTATDAHRVAFFLENGHLPPPEKPCALHRCDFRPCVRGSHLWAGTWADNNADRDAKGRNGMRQHPERAARGDAHYSRTRPELVLRGEQNGSARLTKEQVAAIRLSRANGTPLATLAKEHSVSIATISLIASGKRWAHV